MRLKSGVYSHQELIALLGNGMAVTRAYRAGDIEKIGRGFYATNDIPANRSYFEILKKFYKEAVVSKRTLLYHYGLTTDQPSLIDIDVPIESIYRNSTDLFDVYRTSKIFEITKTDFNGVVLRSYSVHRAVFEVLYFEKDFGILTNEVIRNYVQKFKYDPDIIVRIALRFGARGKRLKSLISFATE